MNDLLINLMACSDALKDIINAADNQQPYSSEELAQLFSDIQGRADAAIAEEATMVNVAIGDKVVGRGPYTASEQCPGIVTAVSDDAVYIDGHYWPPSMVFVVGADGYLRHPGPRIAR